MKEHNFDIDDLIIRYLSGETSHKENKLVSVWINENPENRLYFISFRDIWLATAQVEIIPFRKGSALQNKDASVNTTGSAKIEDIKLPSPVFNEVLKVAAVVLVAIFIGAFGYRQFSRKTSDSYKNEVVVEAMFGSKVVTTLPDGTRVWLNGGTKLTYNGNYNTKIREVSLSGEAYFDVITNPSKPFIVNADKLSIKAMGTSFNVKAYPNDRSIVTTLVRGHVIIEGKDYLNHPFVIQMKPKETVSYHKKEPINDAGQMNKPLSAIKTLSGSKVGDVANYSNPVIKLEKVKTELYTSWKDERWVIEKQNMESLVQDFERRFNIKVLILSSSIKGFHFTGTIQNETIEQIMVIMRHTIPMKYKIEQGIITIDEDKLLMDEFRSKN